MPNFFLAASIMRSANLRGRITNSSPQKMALALRAFLCEKERQVTNAINSHNRYLSTYPGGTKL